MIDVPSLECLCELAQKSAAPELRRGEAVQCQEMALAKIAQAMQQVASGRSLVEGVIEAGITGLAGVALVRPLLGSDNRRLAASIIRELARINDVLLDPPLHASDLDWLFESSEPTADAALLQCESELRRRLVRIDDLISFTELVHADVKTPPAPRAFIGCAMTGVPQDDLDSLERASADVADTLSERGLAVYQPVTMFHPYRMPGAASDPRMHDEDLRQLVRADLVIGFIDRPSTGLGMVLAYAERSHCLQLIFMRGGAARSPLLLGTTADAEFYEFTDPAHLSAVVNDFLVRHDRELLARQALRSRRANRYGPVLNALRDGLRGAADDRLNDPTVVALNRRRTREILLSVDYLATATLEEVNALAELLGLGMLRLDADLSLHQLRTLLAAQSGFGWADSVVTVLLQEARLELARPGTRRLDLDSIEGWKAFFDHRKRRRG